MLQQNIVLQQTGSLLPLKRKVLPQYCLASIEGVSNQVKDNHKPFRYIQLTSLASPGSHSTALSINFSFNTPERFIVVLNLVA